jgi:hypothetical protein
MEIKAFDWIICLPMRVTVPYPMPDYAVILRYTFIEGPRPCKYSVMVS